MCLFRAVGCAVLLALLFGGCSPPDYTSADMVDIQAFEPVGQPEPRVILQDTRIVRNCLSDTAGSGSVLHEALVVGADNEVGVEWTVGSEQGTGYIVKATPMPVEIDITKPLGSAIRMQVKSATAQRETGDLVAEANHVVEYSYQVSEIWQPGHVQVTFKYLDSVSIEVRYRCGLKLEITGLKSQPCPGA